MGYPISVQEYLLNICSKIPNKVFSELSMGSNSLELLPPQGLRQLPETWSH